MQPVSDLITGRIDDTHEMGASSVAALSLFAANAGLPLVLGWDYFLHRRESRSLSSSEVAEEQRE